MSCVKLNPDSVYSIMLQYLVNRNSFHRFIVVFQWDRTYSPPCMFMLLNISENSIADDLDFFKIFSRRIIRSILKEKDQGFYINALKIVRR